MTEFPKLLIASFISQTGSHFLTLALSAFVLMSSGSPIQAGLVFVLSYLPSILVGTRLGHWVDHQLSRWLIARNELISISTTLACAACIRYHLPLALFCLVLAGRSILVFISRAAATKWLKLITPPAAQTGRIKIFYLSFFLSTTISGLMAAFVLSHSTIWTIALIDAFTYVIGMVFYLNLKPIVPTNLEVASPEGPAPSLRETLTTIFRMPAVRASFLTVCFSQALFQGAYSALVSYLPMRVFQMGYNGVGIFQLAASVGITGGFLVNWFAPQLFSGTSSRFPIRTILTALLAILALVSCVSVGSFQTGLASFFVLNFTYECIWLHHNSEFFRASPKHHAARYQFTLSSCAAFLMSLLTLAYSTALQFFDAGTGVTTVLAAGIALFSGVALFATSRRTAPVAWKRIAP